MTATKDEYNVIISLGSNCACTLFLRHVGLQKESFPFDWLSSHSFEARVLLLANGFKNFFNREDFVMTKKNTSNDGQADIYRNNKTGFFFHHDFPSDCSLEDVFCEVNKKYERRIKRLYDKIETSKRVLFVWLDSNYCLTEKQILDGYVLLSQKFPHQKISFLIVEHDPHSEMIERKKYVVKIGESVEYAVKYTYNVIADPNNKDALYLAIGDGEGMGMIFNQYALRSH